jgi:hypothetical protein
LNVVVEFLASNPGPVVWLKTEDRSPLAVGASAVLGAGRLKVNVCTVDAGCNVDAMISTSLVKESFRSV